MAQKHWALGLVETTEDADTWVEDVPGLIALDNSPAAAELAQKLLGARRQTQYGILSTEGARVSSVERILEKTDSVWIYRAVKLS